MVGVLAGERHSERETEAQLQSGAVLWRIIRAEDPEEWNIFRRRLTYTCPVGYIIDRPDGDYSEQPDPIPEEQYSFEASR